MIPKIIHYCWLSDDPFPPKIQRCIDSWKKVLPDYELRLWDFNRFPREKAAWVREAFDSKKYAFAADYIRSYALYTEGGIYLDSDVEVLKSFDGFLNLPYVLGQESTSGHIEAAVMAATKGSPLFKTILEHFEGRHFINEDGSMEICPMPLVLDKVIRKNFRRVDIGSISDFDFDPSHISVFPNDYFSPIHLKTMKLEKTKNTVAIHHFTGTWTTPYHRFKKSVQRFIGPHITWIIVSAKGLFKKGLGIKR